MKKLKIVLIIISILLIISVVILFLLYKDQKIAVLGYHNFVSHEEKTNYSDPMIMDIDKFESQIKYLKEHNYKSLTLDEFYCWKNKTCTQPRKSVLITIDDGYLSNYVYAFKVLKKYNMRAVVFYVGSYITEEEKTWNSNPYDFMSFKNIEDSKVEYPNIEFASHSYNLHIDGSVENMTYEELVNDLQKYKELNDSKYFAYPFGHYNDNIINALKSEGYKMAFTFGPDKEHRKATLDYDNYKIPRLNISNDMSDLKFKLRLLLPY